MTGERGPLLKNALTWLTAAFGLESPDLPSRLSKGEIIPVIDVGQGGWAAAVSAGNPFPHAQHTVAASSAAGTVDLVSLSNFATSKTPGSRIIWLSIAHAGGAGALAVEFAMFHSDGTEVTLGQGSVAVGAKLSHQQLFGSMYPIFCPMDYQLKLRHPGTGVGETLTVHHYRMTVGLGFKPL